MPAMLVLGSRHATGDIVAFADDDVVVDRHWIAALVNAFAHHPDVSCVTGLVIPRALETPVQSWFEDFGGFNRGYTQREFDLSEHRRGLAPLSIYGRSVGRSGEFRVSTLSSPEPGRVQYRARSRNPGVRGRGPRRFRVIAEARRPPSLRACGLGAPHPSGQLRRAALAGVHLRRGDGGRPRSLGGERARGSRRAVTPGHRLSAAHRPRWQPRRVLAVGLRILSSRSAHPRAARIRVRTDRATSALCCDIGRSRRRRLGRTRNVSSTVGTSDAHSRQMGPRRTGERALASPRQPCRRVGEGATSNRHELHRLEVDPGQVPGLVKLAGDRDGGHAGVHIGRRRGHVG